MKKFIRQFIIIFLIICLPFLSFLSYGSFIQENKYGDSFYGELKYKVERLKNIDDKKIVFIGGSSLAFGLRSDEIEKSTGYKVVNFGLYASLGTKIMLDLAIDYIDEGDVVILAPELHQDTYSLMTNYPMLQKCLENCKNLYFKLSADDKAKLFMNYFPFIIERQKANVFLNEPYTLSSFNEYGDIISPVVNQNILYSLYDSSQMVKPNNDLLDAGFIQYINKYNKKVNKKKASMYFCFSPTNQLSLVSKDLSLFEQSLKDNLDFDILGTVEDFTYHQDYFYDTNYHLNYSGSLLHSKTISDLIKTKLNIENNYEIQLVERPVPKYELASSEDYTPYFKLKKYGNSYAIEGVQDDYKNATKIVVPEKINDIVVDGILTGSFANMTSLETIILPATMEQLDGDIFTNCPNLTRIYILNEHAPAIVGNGMLNGTNQNCSIYVLESALTSYTTGYTWANYIKYLRTFKKEIDEQ